MKIDTANALCLAWLTIAGLLGCFGCESSSGSIHTDGDYETSDVPNACIQDALDCQDDWVMRCESGIWAREQDCSKEGLICREGACIEPSDGDLDLETETSEDIEDEHSPDGDNDSIPPDGDQEADADPDTIDGDIDPEMEQEEQESFESELEMESDATDTTEQSEWACNTGACCLDGVWLNEGDTCLIGRDELDCTQDVCNAEHQCIHPVVENRCLIDGQCYSHLDPNPIDACSLCYTTLSQEQWTVLPDGTRCSNGNGSCQSGECVIPCDTGNFGECEDGSADTWNVCIDSRCHIGGALLRMVGHDDQINDIIFDPNGERLYSAGHDAKVKVWQLSDGQLLHDILGHAGRVYALALTPAGDKLISAGEKGTGTDLPIKLWNLSNWTPAGSMGDHSEAVRALAVVNESNALVSGDDAGRIEIRNLETTSEVASLDAHSEGLRGLSVAAGGAFFASGGCKHTRWGYCDEGEIKLWQAGGSFAGVVSDTNELVPSVAFVNDADRLAFAARLDNSGALRVYTISQGQRTLNLTAHAEEINDVAVSPDGAWIATAGCNASEGPSCTQGGIALWSVADGSQVTALHGHNGTVRTLAFSADSRYLASGGGDGTLMVWDLQRLQP